MGVDEKCGEWMILNYEGRERRLKREEIEEREERGKWDKKKENTSVMI